jgi:hypothetical protein
MRRALVMLGTCCAIGGGGIAAFMMYAAWDHNPQGAFHELAAEGGQVIHWDAWGAIGLAWFLATSVPVFLAGGLLLTLGTHLRRKRESRTGS